LPPQAAWQRIEVEWSLATVYYYTGRLVDFEMVADRAEKAARRVGHHGALWVLTVLRAACQLMRTGDIPTALARYDAMSNARWDFFTRLRSCISRLYLGRTADALEGFREIVRLQPADNFMAGEANADLFAATALAGDLPGAQALWDQAAEWLPAEGGLNATGRWGALMAIVSGLALLGDRDRLAGLDPLGQQMAKMGWVTDFFSTGPTNSELCAALTAAAAGHRDRAREHFNRALRVSRDLPYRLLEPNAEYWYGRFEIEQGHRDEGRARLQAALNGFTTYGMVLHRELAEHALSEGA